MKDSLKFLIGLILSIAMIAVSTILLIDETIGIGVYAALMVASIIVLVVPCLFFKGAQVNMDGTSLNIVAPMVNVNIPFDKIDSLHIYDSMSFGVRAFGYSGIRRSSGEFANSAFGSYTCACDRSIPMYILITSGKKKVLFNLSTLESTKYTFEVLRSKVDCEVDDEPYMMTEEDKVKAKRNKKMIIGISLGITALICAIIAIAFLIGSVDVTLTDTDVEIDATMMDESIPYSDISSVELMYDMDYGRRVMGLSSSKVLTGTFNNDDFGSYRLAVYKSTSECVVIHTADETYVVNCDDSESTIGLYNDLLTKITP